MAYSKKDKERYLKELKKSLLNVSIACKNTKIERKTIYNWLKEDPWFRDKFQEVKEERLDFAENAALKAIEQGKETSIWKFLEQQGRSRGYGQRQEIDLNAKVEQQENKIIADKVAFILGNESNAKTSSGSNAKAKR